MANLTAEQWDKMSQSEKLAYNAKKKALKASRNQKLGFIVNSMLPQTQDKQGNEVAAQWMNVSRSIFSLLETYKDIMNPDWISRFYSIASQIDSRLRFGSVPTQDVSGNKIDVAGWLKEEREWLREIYATWTSQ